jgi:hypothetical protein
MLMHPLLPDPDRRRCLLGTGVWLAGGGATQLALANPVSAWPEISGHLPAATLAGSGQLRFFGLAVYRAQLWVDPGFSASTYDEHAFALTLNYQRALQGRAIAERSIQEIKRQVPIAAEQETRWLAAMGATFPNVQEHDRLTGLHQPGSAARFWFNGRALGTLLDASFSARFFGIWLHPATSEPALRLALLAGVTR